MPSSRFESPLDFLKTTMTNTFAQYFDKRQNNFRLKVEPEYFRSYVRSSVRSIVFFFLSFCLFSFFLFSFFLSFSHAENRPKIYSLILFRDNYCTHIPD